MATFSGFPKQGIQFLGELALNNEREWFVANQARYEQHVREPAMAFIRTMAPALGKWSKQFEASDKKVGGSLMRIHRDVRFSSDKSPYKTNIGIQFRHGAGKDVHAPGVYVHVAPDECFLGVGMWHPEPEALAKIRERILEHGAAWKKAIGDAAFKKAFRLAGDALKKPPRGVDPDHPLVEELKRKDHIAVAQLSLATMTSAKCVPTIVAAMDHARPFMRELCKAVGVAF